MNHLDDELKHALRRVEPSPDFGARVLAKVEESSGWAKFRTWFAVPAARWAIATVLIVAVGGGAAWEHERRERERGELAKQQVMTALRIAGAKVRTVQQKVEGIGATESEEVNGL